jgi:hypothetical protein
MVLAMFVDADRVPLLSALAGGSVYVTPSVIDPAETPPFARQPVAEFARGVFAAQRDLSQPHLATRVQRRTAYYRVVGTAWRTVSLSLSELQLARFFASPAAREAARRADPTLRVKRVGAGEAEAAAIAVSRDWTLWSDDADIINLLAALHPGQPIERISDLLIRSVRQGFLTCQEAADLYNGVFSDTLNLWTTYSLVCDNGEVTIQ